MPPLDGFYPLVSLAAFLSGGCFGFYAAWRGYGFRRGRIRELPRKTPELSWKKPELSWKDRWAA